ncbi:hypothetical protein PMAYCL1PPCAC_16541 [Pristionchus mayeri]|uniref:TLC domain-containing protein n=1 Tax=Pristionchus mayeri TaxID=1317129 RepID=A0AAN5CL30_9BILA|nr:hypothetical protein PMAYCL1PPCAC_16541 [Pristionchus mayeri]
MGLFNETYWLPPGIQWSQMPIDARDLLYPVIFTVPMIFLRVLLEAFVAIPIGHFLGYDKEEISSQIIAHLHGGFVFNTRKKRILECFWRFVYYTSMFIYGFKTLATKPWLWDIKECWTGYPWQSVDDDTWYYYMISVTFYCSLLIPSFFDVRRHDYWQMIVHHIIAIILFQLSYIINFVKAAALVNLCHDAADVFIDGWKLIKYDKSKEAISNVIFVLFLICWIVTRLVYFPFVALRSIIVDSPSVIRPDYNFLDPFQTPFAPRIIVYLACCLLGLHVFWTVIIVKMIYKTATCGEVVDAR